MDIQLSLREIKIGGRFVLWNTVYEKIYRPTHKLKCNCWVTNTRTNTTVALYDNITVVPIYTKCTTHPKLPSMEYVNKSMAKLIPDAEGY